MKVCSKCECEKPLEEFPWKQKSKNIRHSYCAECNKRLSSEWYYSNQKRHLKTTLKATAKARQTGRDYIASLNLACSKCGFDHPAALDFHHVDPSEKEDSIARMVNKGCSVKKLQSEMEKCIVLCSNCHRIHHWQERQDSVS